MRPWMVAAAAFLLMGSLGVYVVSSVGITALLGFGLDVPEISEFAETAIDEPIFERSGKGHDGKYFFVLATDPWLTDPTNHARLLDRPTYRTRRILYPLLASGFGSFPDRWLPWSLALLNLAALSAGTWAVAVYACARGRSAWWGFAFALNVGLWSEMVVTGSGVVAFALGVWALVSTERGSVLAASLLATGAVLAREAMLLLVMGVVAWQFGRDRRAAWLLLGLPVTAFAAWAGYVQLRLAESAGGLQIREIGPPLLGLSQSIPAWLDSPVDLATGAAIVVLLLAAGIRTVSSKDVMLWGTVGFGILAILFTRQVWVRNFDITRAVAPLLTGYVVAVFVSPGPDGGRLVDRVHGRHIEPPR